MCGAVCKLRVSTKSHCEVGACPPARHGYGPQGLCTSVWIASLEACSPGTWRAERLLGLAWGYPWMHPHPGRGPCQSPGPPRCVRLRTPSFSSTVCRPCGWRSACAAPGSTQSRRECCNTQAGPASWVGGAIVMERQCMYVRNRAQACSRRCCWKPTGARCVVKRSFDAYLGG